MQGFCQAKALVNQVKGYRTRLKCPKREGPPWLDVCLLNYKECYGCMPHRSALFAARWPSGSRDFRASQGLRHGRARVCGQRHDLTKTHQQLKTIADFMLPCTAEASALLPSQLIPSTRGRLVLLPTCLSVSAAFGAPIHLDSCLSTLPAIWPFLTIFSHKALLSVRSGMVAGPSSGVLYHENQGQACRAGDAL